MNKLIKLVGAVSAIAFAAPGYSAPIWSGKAGYIEFAATAQSCGPDSSGNDTSGNESSGNLDLKPIFQRLSVSTDADNNSYFINSAEQKPHKVFSDAEAKLLADKLVACAEPLKQGYKVNFSLSGQKRSYIGSSYLTSTGTLFLEGDQLNIVFGNILVDKKRKYIRATGSMAHGRFPDERELLGFRLPVGNLDHSLEEKWQLNLFSGAEYVNQRGDWISIDLTRSYAQAPAAITATAAVSADVALPQVQTEPYAASVKEKLQKLKEMHEQGLVPEAVYLEEVKAILKGI